MTHANYSADALARGLGWFSIGLGLAEIVAGRSIARSLGMEDRTNLIRAYGVREIATGVALLAQDDPTPWVWGRVGGDALDLATLATGLDDDNPRRDNVLLAMGTVAAVTAVDIACAVALHAGEEVGTLTYDYSDRSGLPRPADQMRGEARRDFETPADMRAPAAMQPYA